MNLFAACHAILVTAGVAEKLESIDALAAARDQHALWLDRATVPPAPDAPGRPGVPRLVRPREVPRRGIGTPEGRAALLHAIAHIEFNAIHLALDATLRFPALPDAFHFDWIGVALEEAKHFGLLVDSLARRGYRYGSFDAHDGLWEMARDTRHDPLARMALVPRVMEARGLDVTPGIRARFASVGDLEAIGILDIILADEVGHVAIGNRWYHWLCVDRGLDPDTTYRMLAQRHRAPRPHRPINRTARLAGGFTAAELDQIEAETPTRGHG